ncbi:MAG: hypothetical protein AAFQ65_11340 [Myxococcota bacterium]
MKRTIHMCTWLAVASLTGIYGCSGDDDPTPAPTDMSDDDAGGSGDDDGTGRDGEPEPTGLAQGAPCTEDGAACDTGLTCVDGVCCDDACEGVCRSCRGDVSGGFDGTCTFLLAGTELIIEAEDYEDCPGVQTCDGNGACFARAAGESCDSDSQCDSGFCTDGVCCDSRCAGTCESCSTGTCLVVENAPDPGTCSSQCFEGGICDGLAVGDACTSDGECGSEICSDVCVPADGDACCVLANGNVCSDDVDCLNTCISGACAVFADVSGACDDSDDCSGNLACTGGRCLVPDGGTCEGNDACVNGACAQGICGPPRAAGEICDAGDNTDCASPSTCINERCLLPDGEACTAPTQCESDCFGGECLRPRGSSCVASKECEPSTVCLAMGSTCGSASSDVTIEVELSIAADAGGTFEMSCRRASGKPEDVTLSAQDRGVVRTDLVCAEGTWVSGFCSSSVEIRPDSINEVGDVEFLGSGNNSRELRVSALRSGTYRCAVVD